MYILIVLAEALQQDADEPDENDEMSDPKEDDSDIAEGEINDFVGETDDNEDKEVVNAPFCKFTYSTV